MAGHVAEGDAEDVRRIILATPGPERTRCAAARIRFVALLFGRGADLRFRSRFAWSA
nr:hypothetical protein KitaXyl93_01790 [Kitasatospora sp. Xyl93]